MSLITSVQWLTAPLMALIGFAPILPLAIAGECTRSFMRTLIGPVYAAFAMEQVLDRQRATLSSFYSVTWSIGYGVGPTIACWLHTNISLCLWSILSRTGTQPLAHILWQAARATA